MVFRYKYPLFRYFALSTRISRIYDSVDLVCFCLQNLTIDILKMEEYPFIGCFDHEFPKLGDNAFAFDGCVGGKNMIFV